MTVPLWGIAADSGESMLFGNDALGVMMYDSTYDISLKYMKMLFGSDIGINVSGFGNGYTGTLFSYFNYGLLVIIFGYSGFTAFEASLLAGTEGSMFRRKIKPLVMVRIVSGIMLVAPQASGYCLAQQFLMQIVILGVGMANGAWTQGVNYADAFNGSAYVSSTGGKYSDVQTISDKIMLPLYQSTYCVQSNQKEAKILDPNLPSSEWSMRIGTDCEGGDQYTVCFGSSKNNSMCGKYNASLSTNSENLAVQQSIISAATVLQGVAINQLLLEESNVDNGCSSSEPEACIPAVMTVNVSNSYYSNLLPFRTKTSSNQESIVSNSANSAQQGTALQRGWASAGGYFNHLVTGKASNVFGNTGNQSVSFKPLSQFLPSVSQGTGGVSDSDLKNISNNVNTIISDNKDADKAISFSNPSFEDKAISKSILTMMNMVLQNDTFVDDVESKYAVVGSFLSYINLSVGFKNMYALLAHSTQDFTGIQILGDNDWKKLVTKDWAENKINQNCVKKLQESSCQSDSATCMNSIFSSSDCLLKDGVGLVSQIKRRWEIDTQGTEDKSLVPINPFYAMVVIGNKLVINAANFWQTASSETVSQLVTLTWVLYGIKAGILAITTGITAGCMFNEYCVPVAFGAAALASLVMDGVAMLFGAAAFIIDIPSGLGNALATIMYSLGNFLGYFLPFMPMVVFTMAVIGWMILVIEAMVATPLVALGLTSPKGHDFLGQAQQSIMMYVATCLRPVLIIISFFIVINLLYVGFEYLNYVYLMALSGLLNISVSMPSLSLVIVFASMLVYAYFCFTLLVYILETINEIPDKVSRWIGGTMLSPGGNIHQMVSEMKGGVGGSAQGMASGASQSASSATRGVSGVVSQGSHGTGAMITRGASQAGAAVRKQKEMDAKRKGEGGNESSDDRDDMNQQQEQEQRSAEALRRSTEDLGSSSESAPGVIEAAVSVEEPPSGEEGPEIGPPQVDPPRVQDEDDGLPPGHGGI
jgi:hypothetical protein